MSARTIWGSSGLGWLKVIIVFEMEKTGVEKMLIWIHQPINMKKNASD